ncbi:DUF1353 domain-containing protein [Roseivivax sediminis]|uniref:DUF1353 domain-containing protein n=1 Tax=Roseivivax sediminis TaxID=936889 RepID=A0A1I1WFJ2_9RHOB|nr:DUF1353 domain-containing protein [Roseivivax sediminis]SFD93954.1 Protein of unknown function [Roseivivax sediminis]
MTRALPLLALCLALPACDVTHLLTEDEVRDPANICLTGAPGTCAFEGAPVELRDDPRRLPGRSYTFYPMARAVSFADGTGRTWVAPAGTLTDGASIPPIFVPIVGRPTAPEVRGAAAVHDAYCGVGNEAGPAFHKAEWPDVHRMFYDALIAGGTEPVRAKLMFAAVYLGGPRWTIHRPDTDPSRDLSAVPAPRKQQAMRRAKSYIESSDPDPAQLERFLLMLERQMLQEMARLDSDADSRTEQGGEPSYEGYEPQIEDFDKTAVDRVPG